MLTSRKHQHKFQTAQQLFITALLSEPSPKMCAEFIVSNAPIARIRAAITREISAAPPT